MTRNETIIDHQVVLDEQGRLLPWTSYTNIFKWSMNFIKNCPTIATAFGNDPCYLVTSFLGEDGSFVRNQNTQGGNTYWAVETLKRYYAYTADRDAFKPVILLAERVLHYHTPKDWAWPNVPRTQDGDPIHPLDPGLPLDEQGNPIIPASTANGEYTDESSEVDKICMVAVAYVTLFKLTREEKYLDSALAIAEVIVQHVSPGDGGHSPLPFRVNLKTGEVLDCYSTDMIPAIRLFDELNALGYHGCQDIYRAKRDIILKWILQYPVKTNQWSGYYEDNKSGLHQNLDQQSPMETARYLLQHPDLDPEYKCHVLALIAWVKNRFGKIRHYGATSVMEQDLCMLEMGSHTARYASIVAKWFGVTDNTEDREEARASFAMATYSAYNRYSKDGCGINRVGISHPKVWFSDSYFDYLPHMLDGMADLPEMAPEDEDHIISSTSVVTTVQYGPDGLEYETFDPDGAEILRLTFKPKVLANGRPLDNSQWTFGNYRGVSNILRIQRQGVSSVVIKKTT
ncbi:MAG: hypothetical protein WC975_09680 [Phycisphaerae bacterium]